MMHVGLNCMVITLPSLTQNLGFRTYSTLWAYNDELITLLRRPTPLHGDFTWALHQVSSLRYIGASLELIGKFCDTLSPRSEPLDLIVNLDSLRAWYH